MKGGAIKTKQLYREPMGTKMAGLTGQKQCGFINGGDNFNARFASAQLHRVALHRVTYSISVTLQGARLVVLTTEWH